MLQTSALPLLYSGCASHTTPIQANMYGGLLNAQAESANFQHVISDARSLSNGLGVNTNAYFWINNSQNFELLRAPTVCFSVMEYSSIRFSPKLPASAALVTFSMITMCLLLPSTNYRCIAAKTRAMLCGGWYT